MGNGNINENEICDVQQPFVINRHNTGSRLCSVLTPPPSTFTSTITAAKNLLHNLHHIAPCGFFCKTFVKNIVSIVLLRIIVVTVMYCQLS